MMCLYPKHERTPARRNAAKGAATGNAVSRKECFNPKWNLPPFCYIGLVGLV